MKTRISRCVVVVVLALCHNPVWGQEFPKDTDLKVRLLQPISTETSQECDQIRAEVESPDKYKGDFMTGNVNAGTHSSKGESVLRFSFTELQHAGRPVPIKAQPKSVKNSQGKSDVDEEGRIVAMKEGHKRRNAALGAIIGAATGAATGNVKNMVIGTVVGAAGGVLVAEFVDKAPKISFATGSEFILVVQDGKGKPAPCRKTPSK